MTIHFKAPANVDSILYQPNDALAATLEPSDITLWFETFDSKTGSLHGKSANVRFQEVTCHVSVGVERGLNR
jgi:hypothetical protein